MAANDYKICPAAFNAYLAKVSKRNPNLMLQDRRALTDAEIIDLIDWYVSKKCEELKTNTFFLTANGKPIVELKDLRTCSTDKQ